MGLTHEDYLSLHLYWNCYLPVGSITLSIHNFLFHKALDGYGRDDC